ncbi:MarR family transcriptional regulator [Nakamurella silvestris]|nr:MarR family transcriptional regulator [Nakamurella silvestris]
MPAPDSPSAAPHGTTLPAEDPLALEAQVCFALVVAARSVLGIYRPILEPMGLTHPQYLVMLALWQQAPLSVKDLSSLLQLDPGTLSPLLKRLESAGLVTRERSTSDERLLSVNLTAKGVELRNEAAKIPAEVVAKLGMPLTEIKQVHTALLQVIAAAGQA